MINVDIYNPPLVPVRVPVHDLYSDRSPATLRRMVWNTILGQAQRANGVGWVEICTDGDDIIYFHLVQRGAVAAAIDAGQPLVG